MEIDLELYRRSVTVSEHPRIRLSVIDIAPDSPERTLVFIHGYGGYALHWKYQLQEFWVKNRVIALDLRGHGHSSKPPGKYTMDEIQADLVAALDALGVSEKIVMIGHSFGGAVVTEFVYRNPERVERMILIASSGEYKLDPLRSLGLNMPVWLMRVADRFTRPWLHAPFRVLKPWYHNNLSKWVGWSMMRDITVPALVIRGHRDRIFATHMFEEVARVLPNAEEVDMGASAHMVMLERRDATNRAIKRFLEQAPRSWRESEARADESARAVLLRERPWLKHYESGVPYTVAIPNVPVHQFLRSAARRFPSQTALIFEGRRISYRQLEQEVNRFANVLRGLGLEHRDRVMLLLPNIPQMVIAFYAVLKAGGVPVFTLPDTGPEELVRRIEDSGTRVLLTIPQFGEAAQAAMQQAGVAQGGPLEHLVFTSVAEYLPALKRLALLADGDKRKQLEPPIPAGEGIHDYRARMRAAAREFAPANVSPHDLAAIVYTGGTTADPKGVMLSHRNLVANTLQTRHWIPEARQGRERFLCVIPFSHIYGLTTALNIPVSIAATLILKPRFEVQEVLETIKRYRPTLFPGVPQMYVAIASFPGVRKYRISSINACISGSAPLAIEAQEQFEKLTRGRLVEGYGLTEASPVTHANPLSGLRKIGSIGIPLPSTEAKIVDLAKRKHTVPTGQIGELAVRGPQVMLGYWQNEEETQKVLTPDGWLLTGDVAQMDADGYFRIIARKADMWYPAKPGEPAFPRDVEEVLYEIPQVKEAAVVAIAGQPIAFLIAHKKERPKVADVLAYCKRRLPPELVPRLVIFVDDFPRTFIGKVLRRELARRYKHEIT